MTEQEITAINAFQSEYSQLQRASIIHAKMADTQAAVLYNQLLSQLQTAAKERAKADEERAKAHGQTVTELAQAREKIKELEARNAELEKEAESIAAVRQHLNGRDQAGAVWQNGVMADTTTISTRGGISCANCNGDAK